MFCAVHLGGFCAAGGHAIIPYPCVPAPCGWQELRRATNSRARDGLRLLWEIQGLGDKIDNLVRGYIGFNSSSISQHRGRWCKVLAVLDLVLVHHTMYAAS